TATDSLGGRVQLGYSVAVAAGDPPPQYSLQALAYFDPGWDPNPGLVFDSGGNLFGSTRGGGTAGFGGGFELKNGRAKIKVLRSFNNDNTGANPSSLVMDEQGNLWGTTTSRVPSGRNFGLVFEVPATLSWVNRPGLNVQVPRVSYGDITPVAQFPGVRVPSD